MPEPCPGPAVRLPRLTPSVPSLLHFRPRAPMFRLPAGRNPAFNPERPARPPSTSSRFPARFRPSVPRSASLWPPPPGLHAVEPARSALHASPAQSLPGPAPPRSFFPKALPGPRTPESSPTAPVPPPGVPGTVTPRHHHAPSSRKPIPAFVPRIFPSAPDALQASPTKPCPGPQFLLPERSSRPSSP